MPKTEIELGPYLKDFEAEINVILKNLRMILMMWLRDSIDNSIEFKHSINCVFEDKFRKEYKHRQNINPKDLLLEFDLSKLITLIIESMNDFKKFESIKLLKNLTSYDNHLFYDLRAIRNEDAHYSKSWDESIIWRFLDTITRIMKIVDANNNYKSYNKTIENIKNSIFNKIKGFEMSAKSENTTEFNEQNEKKSDIENQTIKSQVADARDNESKTKVKETGENENSQSEQNLNELLSSFFEFEEIKHNPGKYNFYIYTLLELSEALEKQLKKMTNVQGLRYKSNKIEPNNYDAVYDRYSTIIDFFNKKQTIINHLKFSLKDKPELLKKAYSIFSQISNLIYKLNPDFQILNNLMNFKFDYLMGINNEEIVNYVFEIRRRNVNLTQQEINNYHYFRSKYIELLGGFVNQYERAHFDYDEGNQKEYMLVLEYEETLEKILQQIEKIKDIDKDYEDIKIPYLVRKPAIIYKSSVIQRAEVLIDFYEFVDTIGI